MKGLLSKQSKRLSFIFLSAFLLVSSLLSLYVPSTVNAMRNAEKPAKCPDTLGWGTDVLYAIQQRFPDWTPQNSARDYVQTCLMSSDGQTVLGYYVRIANDTNRSSIWDTYLNPPYDKPYSFALKFKDSSYNFAFNTSKQHIGDSYKSDTFVYDFSLESDTYGLLETNVQTETTSFTDNDGIKDNKDKPIIRPDFKYTKSDRLITAKDENQTLPTITPDEGYTIEGYKVEWNLIKCKTYQQTGNICQDSQQSNYQLLPQNQDYSFEVTEKGEHQLSAQYLVEQCYRYPSYPATPDYCFNVDLGTELENYSFTSTTVYLNIDGTTSQGDTKDGTCDSSGFCTPESPYEDCSTYGTDIIGGFGCQIRNFFTMIKIFFTNLLTPHPQIIANEFSKITKDMTNNNSIIAIITSPLSLITALTSTTCTSINIPLPFVNRDENLPCMDQYYTNHFGPAFAIYQIIVTGIISYYVLLNIFNMVKGFKDPKNDRIEAVTL